MKGRTILGGVAAIICALVAAWAFGWFEGEAYSDDPKVAELEKLRDENVPKLQSLSEDERRAQREQFGKQMQGLTPQQRMAFFESSMPVFVPMMAREFEKRYDELMAKSPEEQRKELDKRIDSMQARGGPPGPGGSRPNIDPKKMDEIRKKMLDWTTPEQRAKFENGIQLMNQRRKERGLDPLPPGPGGGFF
jgi:hypothetical protein